MFIPKKRYTLLYLIFALSSIKIRPEKIFLKLFFFKLPKSVQFFPVLELLVKGYLSKYRSGKWKYEKNKHTKGVQYLL